MPYYDHDRTPSPIPLSVLTDSQRNDILNAVDDSEIPWYSGMVNWPSDSLLLFYKVCSDGGAEGDKSETSETAVKCVDLLSATPRELESLSSTCAPATFGMNQENVLDETYRKAKKLDLENFGLSFSPEELGFSDIIKNALLTPKERTIVFERYKINIYGEGSFFKPHKDTPRSQNMFGSLVIVFLTPHEGGELIVSHGENSSTIDFANIFKSQIRNALAYATFYSDVNHEVGKVTSGYRVSLTYNLYYAEDDEVEGESDKLVHVSLNTSYEHACARLHTTLSRLLQDPEFVPNGGILGFALKYEYPIPANATDYVSSNMFLNTSKSRPQGDKPLEPLKKYLKGSDAVIFSVCKNLGLTVALKFVYRDEIDSEECYLSDFGLRFDWRKSDEGYEVQSDLRNSCEVFVCDWSFTWVQNKSSRDTDHGTILKSPYIAYGNESTLDFMYGKVSLVVWVGAQGKRGEWEKPQSYWEEETHDGPVIRLPQVEPDRD